MLLIIIVIMTLCSTLVECHGGESHGENRASTDGCPNGAQSCFSNPTNCNPTVTSGCVTLLWNYTSSTNIFDFVITGSAQYVSFAFATIQAMEDADMYYCTTGRFGSAAITTMTEPNDLTVDPSTIPTNSHEVVDGVVKCTFQRVASLDKTVSGGNSKTFDLPSTNFYIIWAFGDTSANGFVTYHQSNRGSSAEPVNFTSGAAIAPGDNTNSIDMVKAHACLMVLAWICFAGIGVIVARHFKPLWHESTINSQKVWFQIHRLLMVAAVVFTVIGIILIFIAREGFSESAGSHAITGLVTLGLAVLNPILALFRPHPDAPRRVYFNYGHWFVGSAARILGIVFQLRPLVCWLSCTYPWYRHSFPWCRSGDVGLARMGHLGPGRLRRLRYYHKHHSGSSILSAWTYNKLSEKPVQR